MKALMIRVGSGIGGAEVYNLNLIKGFKKYHPKTEFFFISNQWSFSQKLKKLGVKTWTLVKFNRELGTKKDLLWLAIRLPKYLCSYLKIIKNIQKKYGLDLICLQGVTEKITLTPFLKKLGLKVIWLEHGPVFDSQKSKIILNWYKIISRLADKIITVSQDSRRNLIKNGVKKAICISTGIDTDYFSADKVKKFKGLTVGFVGAVCQKKGIRDFIQTAYLIKQTMPEIKFMVIGQGPMLNWTKKAIKILKMDKNFVFTGFQKDIRPFLKAFDVFFFPTLHFEGLSLALLEAASMSKPIVARDIGGNKEIVLNNKTGYLFKNNEEKAAELIIKLLINNKKRQKMGEAARKWVVKNLGLKRWVGKMQKEFQSLKRPKVSVIIPTYNRGRPLIKTLKSLFNQDYSDYEIIIIDQSTKIFLTKKRFLKKYSRRLKIWQFKKPNLPAARNFGFKKAQGKIILFCDDDVAAPSKLISHHVQNYTDAIDAVAGRVINQNEKLKPHCRRVGKIYPWGTVIGGYSSQIRQEINNFFGCNFSVRREILKKLGGFDENFIGNALREETDLALRLKKTGGRIIFDPQAKLIHYRSQTGGCRKNENRLKWYHDFFHNETYFFLKHLKWYWWSVFWLTRWQYFIRCMFGFGREINLRSLKTPWLGIYHGWQVYKKLK